MKKVLLFYIIAWQSAFATITQATLRVKGMVCSACTTVIKNQLKSIADITHIDDVNLKDGTVTIHLKSDNTYTKTQLTDALRKELDQSTYQFDEIIDIKE